MQRYDPSGRPIIEPRAGGATALLAATLLGLAEVLEPRPPRDLGSEVADAPVEEPDLPLTFGSLEPL